MVRPKKHLGQHFLTDPGTAERIVNSLSFKSKILEIGPGKGILTQFLYNRDKIDLHLVEIDAESVSYLEKTFPETDIIRNDFLKLDILRRFGGNQLSILGNFPYNISSQIVFKILENRELIPEMVGMFQREVARRIASPPGSREYGILSVLTQAYYHVEYLFTVNEGVFFPKPKVKSGVIRLERKSEFPEVNYDEFRQFIKTAFNQRRKQLRNTIKSYLKPGYDHSLLSSRPEQLDYNEFLEIYRDIQSLAS